MIPILFDSTETTFASNGLGRLADITDCVATEERNGIFEVQFSYPITGRIYNSIKEGRIIYCTYDDSGTKQPFVIYRRSAPINGIVTFNAHHISYRLSNVILKPITTSGIANTFSAFTNASNLLTANAFSFWTDKTTAGTFKTSHPVSIRSILAGTEGSILDVFGSGEYKFDKFTVRLYASRGADNHVTIRYGKNLTDLKQEVDAGAVYNAVVPFFDNGTDVVYGSIVYRSGVSTSSSVVPLDLTQNYSSSVPSAAQLETAAANYLANNRPWIPGETLDIDFVALWQTQEYANIAPLERVHLCDTVTVTFTQAGIVNAKLKVVKTEYDVLGEKYKKITLGDSKTTFAETLLTVANTFAKKEINYTKNVIVTDFTNRINSIGGMYYDEVPAPGGGTYYILHNKPDIAESPVQLRITDEAVAITNNALSDNPTWYGLTVDGNFIANILAAYNSVIVGLASGSHTQIDTDYTTFYGSVGDVVGRIVNGATSTYAITRTLMDASTTAGTLVLNHTETITVEGLPINDGTFPIRLRVTKTDNTNVDVTGTIASTSSGNISLTNSGVTVKIVFDRANMTFKTTITAKTGTNQKIVTCDIDNATIIASRPSYFFGKNLNVTGKISFATGINNSISSDNSFVAGAGNSVTMTDSAAIGTDLTASGYSQLVIGINNIPDTSNQYAFIVGNDFYSTGQSNGLTLDWFGNLVTAGDVKANGKSLAETDSFTSTTNTTHGITLKAGRNKTISHLVHLVMSGTTDQTLSTSNDYVTIQTLGSWSSFITNSVVKYVIIGYAYICQLNITTAGAIRLGYSRRISDDAAVDIPSGTNIYIDETIFLT